MSVEIIAFHPDHAAAIELQAEQQAEEWAATTEHGAIAELHARGPTFTAIDGGRVLCIAGLAQNHDRYATAWALFAPAKGAAMLAVTRAIARVIAAADYDRIDMMVRVPFTRAHDFARLLGFELEAILRRWGADGSDFAIYTRFSNKGQS